MLVITQPLQVGLCSLFHRLYALYPCNFISYLKQQYTQRDQFESLAFNHTIRPMLESVRMHPLLVTASKDAEISTNRYHILCYLCKIIYSMSRDAEITILQIDFCCIIGGKKWNITIL